MGGDFGRVLFSSLDAVGAELHTLAVHGFGLQIEIKAAAGLDHGMTAGDPHLRTTITAITYFCHSCRRYELNE